jgi:hypothetical protein
MKASSWFEPIQETWLPNLLGPIFKRRLRNIHNPLYPPYHKWDIEIEEESM